MFIGDIFNKKKLNESLRDGEYYTFQVFFDDGTDETLNFSSDDIDWDQVGAKRGKQVVNIERLGGIQGSQSDAPSKPHEYSDDRGLARAQRAYDKQMPEGKGFRGVGGARSREDDERTDLDPTDWYVVKDGKMFSVSVYPRQVAQAKAQGYSRTQEQARAKSQSQGVAEAIPYALSAANAAAEYRRQGAAGGGYQGRIDIPVQSREDYLAVGQMLSKAAKAAGQKIEYGLSDGVMSVFSDSMTSDELDEFIDRVLDQDLTEGSVQDKLYKRHQELRKKRGAPDPDYYKELRATYDLPDEERYAKAAELKKKYQVKESTITNEDRERYLDEIRLAGYDVVTESATLCPECGGAAFEDKMLAEKQDACYHKVKSRYKVWPSAYASGALVRCRKKGAANWGNKSKK